MSVKLQALVEELKIIKDECLGEDKKEKKPKKKSSAESFIYFKEEITVTLDDIAKRVVERNEMIEKYGRTQNSIRLGLAIQKDIEKCKGNFNTLQEILAKQKKKGKLTPEELESREKVLNLLQVLIKDVDSALSNPRARPKANNRIASAARQDMEAEEKKKEEQERLDAKKNKGKKPKKPKKKKGDSDSDSDEEDETGAVEMQQLSHEEQVFIQQAAERDQQIDAKLDEVLNGILILKDISVAIHDEVTVQQSMLSDTEAKMGQTINKFRFANKTMTEILEKSGGASRWCPVIILVIVLIALSGYILTIVGK
eukprot:TRINITY_DN3552_c0_g1_i9.p1 TRINITY_DN3552_c0_g1~~TRINITY_DN3552_c0_g1_i9.p1  ORF type:complete len:312 (+),score=62.33 TRINITY_DN3552_c0_g1_i9:97-1032(+)